MIRTRLILGPVVGTPKRRTGGGSWGTTVPGATCHNDLWGPGLLKYGLEGSTSSRPAPSLSCSAQHSPGGARSPLSLNQ